MLVLFFPLLSYPYVELMIEHSINNLSNHILPQSIHVILPIIHPAYLPRQSLRSNTRKHAAIPPILLFRRFLKKNQSLLKSRVQN